LRFRQDARAFGESRRILPVLRSRISVDESRRMVYGGSWPVATTGDLDGSEIQIDYDQDIEAALFVLIHLFGHTVQWNLSARAREIGSAVAQSPTPELLQELYEYELEACRYSLALLHANGVYDLDQWVADYAHCDFAYLHHFYVHGEKRPFRSFWVSGTPKLEELAVPEFRPTRWISRGEGIVI
jgi:hypothetical protein